MTARPAFERVPERAHIDDLADGDLSALGELYDLYADDVRRFAMRATGTLDVAEDITHDTFIALTGAAKRYDGSHPPRSFLIGIAAKLIMRRKRKLAIRFKWLAQLARQLTGVDLRTPEAAASTDEELKHYCDALARLSEAKRITVLMADVEGLSGAEIAQALDIPIGTVWTRLHHARAELLAAIAREGGR